MTELDNRYDKMLQYIDLIASHDKKPNTADIFITKALKAEQRNINRKGD